ncbi:UDP-2,3-diacylglucosamine diphosphatase LpxI [Rhizobium sp. TRM95111]|uniref:LpxI family protein n=1 Tax=Rhizobium alarense TaxID=2846851 RepID=UPI001F30B8C1|nr:UDP-2,3-diacylglucosamine diphosphatase LpxI [Rhizobium alarense]MCF3639073.1 UDP-2,3-diacylglucosamine diphosphatase LpxI [Rhizobium alarense]
MAGAGAGSGDRLAIIAGGGLLPRHVAEAARAGGESPFVIALDRESDVDWNGFETVRLEVGDFAGITKTFVSRGIGRVVLSGGVRRRPDWRAIRPTIASLRKIPSVLRTLRAGGDDAVLKMVIGLIEASGARVIGVQDILPNLLATAGPLGRHAPDDAARRDITVAAAAATALGRLDVGQGAVAVGGRVVALEGPEGTDAMLARVAALKADGRISARRRGVLVKLCKPQQELRADLPSIGPATVENAHAAGLAGIALEAGRTLVLERDRVVATADRLGLFVTGLVREAERPEEWA